MLVLTRERGQSIIIDGSIEVVVVSIHKSRIKLGIRAPEGVRVNRAEVEARGPKEDNHDAA